MSDHYDKIREDADFRREVAERVGIGLFQALGMFQAPANKWSLQRHEWKEVSGVPNGTIFELFLKSS